MKDAYRHLFVIGHNVFKSIDVESLDKTLEAMFEFDICNPPFEKIDIKIETKMKDLFKWVNAKNPKDFSGEENLSWTWRYHFGFNDKGQSVFEYQLNQGYGFKTEKEIALNAHEHGLFDKMMQFEKISSLEEGYAFFIDNERSMANRIFQLLVATLAIKNIEKTTIEHKKFEKIKTNKTSQVYKYITTLKIGKITETYRSDSSSNTTVRPHMRRGHIRNQHFGEGNKEIKKIFIQPVFVNADEGWIENQRKAYVVKAA